ncbi:1-aminocyclopropane-1-carboxylate oxidase 5-like [Cynara cardunculus var. scolymus]|uniref:Non-heme dioxygenase N-terminal domain-containing protein n=1 Tax=Cynara cardunculus var. scolymus TaxID=59895 RepID=A0A124SC00_CYNCS|nr:1-aminocyclopropane-1-carboxylate oxidase 5-like [Cynara cardunculus var. scolymus]KVH92242.1 Non-heme dioxygenase N-terminal domain-containing protein [Cynara cardunculus var. scolymus]
MAIPLLDLTSILNHSNQDERKKTVDQFGKACLEFGFLHIINHGLPDELVNRSRELTQRFFDCPIHEKLECTPVSTILPAGYGRMDGRFGSNEWLMVCQPCLGFNIFPLSVPQVRETLEEIYHYFQKLGAMMEGMMNEYLGLPQDFLKQFNDDRSKDVLMCWQYPPAVADNPKMQLGREEHQDTNCFTFLLQDDAGGLEYEKDGSWMPVAPMEGCLVVNVGSIIQALTNKKLVAARHRVWKPKGRTRHSFAFFYNIGGEKWIEPLPQFTEEIGKAPKYKGFFYKELLQARLKKETNPSTLREEVLDLDHFAIPS